MNRPLLFSTSLLLGAMLAPAGEVMNASRPIKREVRGDLTLEQAVEIALRQNPDLLKQLTEIERTRGLVIETRGKALPHLSVRANYDQQDRGLVEQFEGGGRNTGPVPEILVPAGPSPGPGEPAPTVDIVQLFSSSDTDSRTSPDKTWEVRFEVRQVIYSGGQVRAGLAIARFTEDSAYYQLRDVVDQVIAVTRVQFYNVLTNRALITVQEESVRLQEDLLKDQRNRFEAGTVPRFNVLRAEVELANTQPLLLRARNDYLIAQTELARTLGLNPGPGGKPTFNCVGQLGVTKRPFDVLEALELGKARRPFLKVQRQQIKIQAEQIKIALAGYKPRIDGSAGYLVRNSRLSDDISETVDGWFFGFTGSWDIFDGFETYGRVKQTRAALEAARINYSDAVLQVELEVQQAYANLITARETIRSQQKNVEQAKEALRLANERFGAGAGTQLEILDARVALTRAQTTELQARGDYNKALAEFDRATAIDTAYLESFRDPLEKLERKILGKRAASEAEPGLLTAPVSKPVTAKQRP